MHEWAALLLLAPLATAAACGGSSDESPESGGTAGTAGSGATAGTDAGSGGAGGANTGGVAGSGAAAGSGGAPFSGVAGCGATPPPGAAQPDPLPSYAGTCPALVAGSNTIQSSGNDRKFMLALPADPKPGEVFPVVFLWHWLGGDAQGFYDKGEIQAAVDTQRFVAVLPEKKGDVLFTWPVEGVQSQARVDEELAFFDDMLACVGSELTVNESCVSSVGVSAGALWTDILAHERSTHLSSFISLSGGVGGVIRPWKSAPHKLPGIVLWGGPTDNCAGLLKFEDISHTLEDELIKDGHFFVECVHNCGHSEPPFAGPAGYSKYKGLWDFVLDHPYWLAPGESPYSGGLPADMPEWCGIGKDSATPRTGVCDNPSQC